MCISLSFLWDYLFGWAHARWKQWNDGKHILEGVQHRYKCHHAHWEGVVVTWHQNHLQHTKHNPAFSFQKFVQIS